MPYTSSGIRGSSWRSFLIVALLASAILALSATATVHPKNRALFIGNCITCGNCGAGMSASDPEHDYFAICNERMSEEYPGYFAGRINGSDWEYAATSAECAAFLGSMDDYLTSDLAFVVIQLGDNVTTPEKMATLSADMQALIGHVQCRCPNAKVVWVGAWHSTPEKQRIMAESSAATGTVFVDISPFHTKNHESEVGALVQYPDGSYHTVADVEVASYPGDDGMALIGSAVFSALRGPPPAESQ